MNIFSSWVRLHSFAQPIFLLSNREYILPFPSRNFVLAYGNGRSFGDIFLNLGGFLWHTHSLDRFIFFDHLTGVLESNSDLRSL